MRKKFLSLLQEDKKDKEEIINTEVKYLRDGIGKFVEFRVVETDKKGRKK